MNNTSEQISPSPARKTFYDSTSAAQSQPTMVQQISLASTVHQPPVIQTIQIPASSPFPISLANITLQHYDESHLLSSSGSSL